VKASTSKTGKCWRHLFFRSLRPVSLGNAQQKIGYVNSEKNLSGAPFCKRSKRPLATIVKIWQGELDRMSKDLQEKYEDYQKKQGLYNDQTKQVEQKKLIDDEQK